MKRGDCLLLHWVEETGSGWLMTNSTECAVAFLVGSWPTLLGKDMSTLKALVCGTAFTKAGRQAILGLSQQEWPPGNRVPRVMILDVAMRCWL